MQGRFCTAVKKTGRCEQPLFAAMGDGKFVNLDLLR